MAAAVAAAEAVQPRRVLLLVTMFNQRRWLRTRSAGNFRASREFEWRVLERSVLQA